jgi:hypothetical protein
VGKQQPSNRGSFRDILSCITEQALYTGIDSVSSSMAENLYAPSGGLVHAPDHAMENQFNEFVARRFGCDPRLVQPGIIMEATDMALPPDRLYRITSQATATLGNLAVQELIGEVHDRARKKAAGLIDAAETLRPADAHLLAAVGCVAMLRGHKGQTRSSNGRMYAYHPLEVAGMIRAAMIASDAPDDEIESAVFQGETHDVGEDQEEFVLSPLVVYYVHKDERIKNPFAEEAAEGTQLMIYDYHPKKRPWAPTRVEYANALVTHLHPRRTKSGDTSHNLWERKPGGTPRQRQKRGITEGIYFWIKERIVEEANLSSDAERELRYHEHIHTHVGEATVMADELLAETFGREIDLADIMAELAKFDANHGVANHLVSK